VGGGGLGVCFGGGGGVLFFWVGWVFGGLVFGVGFFWAWGFGGVFVFFGGGWVFFGFFGRDTCGSPTRLGASA